MTSVDQGELVGALLIDLSKAFDTVSHQLLLSDLCQIGCSAGVVDWFNSYLTIRQQRVVQGSEVTEWKNVTRGVP